MRTCRRFSCGRAIGQNEDVCAECRGQESLFPADPPLPSLDDVRVVGQRLQVFETLCEMQRRDPRGANAFELQAWLTSRGLDRGIERNAIGSRFRELQKQGLVEQVAERQAPTGKPEKVFAPTARGMEWRNRKAAAA